MHEEPKIIIKVPPRKENLEPAVGFKVAVQKDDVYIPAGFSF